MEQDSGTGTCLEAQNWSCASVGGRVWHRGSGDLHHGELKAEAAGWAVRIQAGVTGWALAPVLPLTRLDDLGQRTQLLLSGNTRRLNWMVSKAPAISNILGVQIKGRKFFMRSCIIHTLHPKGIWDRPQDYSNKDKKRIRSPMEEELRPKTEDKTG